MRLLQKGLSDERSTLFEIRQQVILICLLGVIRSERHILQQSSRRICCETGRVSGQDMQACQNDRCGHRSCEHA